MSDECSAANQMLADERGATTHEYEWRLGTAEQHHVCSDECLHDKTCPIVAIHSDVESGRGKAQEKCANPAGQVALRVCQLFV